MATWRLGDAACADLTPAQADKFFAGQGNASRVAEAMCAGCPVQAQCLDDALDAESRIPRDYIRGYRAGLTALKRRAILDGRVLEAVS